MFCHLPFVGGGPYSMQDTSKTHHRTHSPTNHVQFDMFFDIQPYTLVFFALSPFSEGSLSLNNFLFSFSLFLNSFLLLLFSFLLSLLGLFLFRKFLFFFLGFLLFLYPFLLLHHICRGHTHDFFSQCWSPS